MSFPKIIAHRGIPPVAPENTLVSFQAALALDIDGIETDVQATKDGELILCHDETLDRTTSGHGWIKDHTFKQIRSLSAGAWFDPRYSGEKIPSLAEFLELVQDTDLLINLEIKNSIIPYPGIEKQIISMIHHYKMARRVIISSFNHYSLLICKSIDPALKTGILYECCLVEPWEYAKKLGADALHPSFHTLTPELIKRASAEQLLVHPYTVDLPADMERMASLGVSGIITNVPKRALSSIHRPDHHRQ